MHRPLTRRELLRLAAASGIAAALAACGSEASDTGSVATRGSSPTPSAIPQPIGVVVTRWRQDPFALGSYSFLATGSEPADRSMLAEPIADRVFFAGEATHRAFPATVHGALMSGRRAAAEVLATGATSVVVVGAGAAGLGAASRLYAEGIDVGVVEGRDRVGGRIWTDDSLGSPIDLGASWVHGVDGNPLTEIADEAGIVRERTDYDNVVVRGMDGAILDDDDIPVEFEVITGIEQEYAADVEDLSPEATEEGADVVGGDVVFPEGYAQILPELQNGYPIELGAVVSSIEYGNDGVVVTTGAGPVAAEAVVMTVPLGVLQAGVIDFVPALPEEKLGAIDRLGMGLLDKVYLRFDEVFWDPDVEFIGYVGEPIDRFAGWVNIAYYTGEPILMAFNAGTAAEAIERQDDEAVVAEALAALRDMYGVDP